MMPRAKSQVVCSWAIRWRRVGCERSSQPLELRLELGASSLELDKTAAFLLDYRGRRALNEFCIRQLGFGARDFAFQTHDLFAETLTLSRPVNFDFQHELEIIDDRHRCVCVRQFFDHG